MQFEQTTSDNKLERKYDVTVPATDIDKEVDEKLVDISKAAKKKGFRDGKVPFEVVKREYGSKVLGEVLDKVVNDSTNTVIKENDLKIASQPKIEVVEFDQGKDLKYKLTVEVLPDVPKIDYKKFKLTKYKPLIEDSDLQEVLDTIKSNYKSFEEVKEDRKSKNGDALVIDFKGYVNDEAFPGGEAKEYQLELGSNSFIPGFEDQLVGKEKGDEVKVNVKFPDEYHSKDLAGKDAMFEVKIHTVKEAVEKELGDEFAKESGFESFDKLKETLTQQLEVDGENIARVLVKRELFDQLNESFDFELPKNMIENELSSITAQIKNSGEHVEDGKTLTDDELKEKYRKLAERRVLLGIIVTEIAANEKVVVTQEDLNKALAEEASRYPGQQQQVYEFYNKNPQMIERLKGPIIEEKVVDIILGAINPQEEEKPVSELKKLVLENNSEF